MELHLHLKIPIESIIEVHLDQVLSLPVQDESVGIAVEVVKQLLALI